MLLTLIIVGAVATWRLTHMLQEETGPWATLDKLRARVDRMGRADGGFREGFFCFKCMSVWIAIILALLLWLLPIAFYLITVPATLSALAIFINDWNNRHE